MEYMMKNFGAKVAGKTQELCAWTRSSLVSKSGQGTTEYAILVGVLVVIAIVAITLFKPKIQELWNSIATSINGL